MERAARRRSIIGIGQPPSEELVGGTTSRRTLAVRQESLRPFAVRPLPTPSPMSTKPPFRSLPAVNDVLEAAPVRAVAAQYAHDQIVAAIRTELQELRRRLGQGETLDGQATVEAVAGRVVERLGLELRPKLRRVI